MLGEVSRLAKESGRRRTRDLLVVTLDHRNHGTRLKHKNTNLAYDRNPQHFIDMAATICMRAVALLTVDGATQDADLIMTFLPAYLFPNGERTIAEYMSTGISLGGNTTWRQLRTDSRIRVAAPIIGLPFEAFGPYLGARAEAGGLPFKPPTFPDSMRSYIESPTSEGAYEGKKILSIHGSLDELVPYRFGKDIIKGLIDKAPDGEVEVFVQDGKGHVCTPEMLRRASEWFWRWGLSEA